MNSFKTKVDLDINDLITKMVNHDNFNMVTPQVEISWNLEMIMRSYGVADLSLSAPDQTIKFKVNIWGDKEDTEKEFELDLKDIQVEANSERNVIKTGIWPTSLTMYKGKYILGV